MFPLSFVLLLLFTSHVLTSPQTDFGCECSYSATNRGYLVKLTRNSDTQNTWIAVYENKLAHTPDCIHDRVLVSSSGYTTDGVYDTFTAGKSGASYQCVLWQGTGSTCTPLGYFAFSCPLNTTTSATSTTRRFLNLLIIIPAIFLLTFLVAALIRRLRSRSRPHTHTNLHHEYELTPYATPTSTSHAPTTHTHAHAHTGGMTAIAVAAPPHTTNSMPYATLAAYPVGGGMAVLHPYTPMPFVQPPQQFVTNVFPVGVPQTNMVYVSDGEVPQLSPLYMATTQPQQRY